ncbi:MAG: hypothetical protein RLY16_2675 [Bacteroidota bacterium]
MINRLYFNSNKEYRNNNWILIIVGILLFSSCTVVQKYQKNQPFVFKNTIALEDDRIHGEERNSMKARLMEQLEDSMKVTPKQIAFLLNIIKTPTRYDSAYANQSARNMQASLLHVGYYHAKVTASADTSKGEKQKVTVTYHVNIGPPTMIDSLTYRLKNADLQQLAITSANNTYVLRNKPVTKAAIINEIGRLIDSFRNHGYYKITTDDLKMRGDTAIQALTNIGDNPFDDLLTLAASQKERNNPTIRLYLDQTPGVDTMRLKKFYINQVIIYPDYNGQEYNPRDFYSDTIQQYIIHHRKGVFKNDFLLRNLYFQKGDLYSQDAYARTINSFNKSGAWQNINIQPTDVAKHPDKLDMILQLVPAPKYGFDANLEASYSTNSNNNASVANAGNLLGLSGNVSLQNRNLGKKGIKMTNSIRAGIELNLNAQQGTQQRINSNELSFNNAFSIPRLIFPFGKNFGRKLAGEQTFTSLNVANTNRIDLFKLFSLGLSYGYELNIHRNRILTIKPVNVEYSNLYDRSRAFDSTLEKNPYLRYSFNTALVMGSSIGITQTVVNKKHPNRQYSIKANFEESGNLFFLLNLNSIGAIKKDLRQFIKLDAEYINTINWKKSSFAWRAFAGFGMPVGKGDSSLPFFKQYFAGGPSSMRGWPIRGIGPGAKPLSAYNERLLADRTGDIRIELSAEYRYNILQIRPNSIYLRGTFFVDAGNIWNMKNTTPNGGYDSLQFKLNLKDIYRQTGVSAGAGFHLDFTYFMIRFDFGFRFKRPDILTNDGWQFPGLSLKKIFAKGELVPDPNNPGSSINDERYRIWRHENFNFSIGLNYPF